jgi:2-polyprenyl-6-methoxyphenol hydroxylase-like FAD-dependent oxidoreductase
VPTLGQGACQAIEDAATLSNCLLQERDVASALSSYQERRLRRANSLSEEARRIGQVGQWRHPAACAIRDWMIRSMPESLRRRQLGEMLHYRA